jgi:hypothetical protein
MHVASLALISRRRTLLALGACFVVAWGVASPGIALDVTRVEEEWELVLLDPAPMMNAPQVTCFISPTGNLDTLYGALEINQQTMPAYVAGGIQLQVWSGPFPLVHKEIPDSKVLSTAQERITWKIIMETQGSTLKFQVLAAASSTWGDFSGGDHLMAVINPSIFTPVRNLNAYTPTLSVAKSCVGFASNRVQSLALTIVRRIMSNGDVYEDATRRPVVQNTSAQ